METAGAAGSFERVLSVDGLVGGLWKLGSAAAVGGMGRTDSEAAFQEFLKRIPSASNLAAIAGSTGALDASGLPPSATCLLPTSNTLPDLVAGLSGGGPSGAIPASGPSGTAGTSAAGAVGAAASGPGGASSNPAGHTGLPRVSSIDFLRIVTQPATTTAAVYANAAAAAALKVDPAGHGGQGLAPPSGPAQLAALGMAEFHPGAMPMQGVVVNAAHHLGNPAAAAAAALQLHTQLGTLPRMAAPSPVPPQVQSAKPHAVHASSHTHVSATSHSDDDDQDKIESRRARRMLSNRESARRSRKRKQEHLSKLETELAGAMEEKRLMGDRVTVLERRTMSLEEENRRVREENERLRDELRFLRNELSDRKDRGAWRREEDQEGGANAGGTKRAQNGRVSGRSHAATAAAAAEMSCDGAATDAKGQ